MPSLVIEEVVSFLEQVWTWTLDWFWILLAIGIALAVGVGRRSRAEEDLYRHEPPTGYW